MKYYFALQLRITKRHIDELGLPLWAAIVIAIGLIGILYSLALRSPLYASYVLPFLQLSILLANSNAQKILFLKTTFTKKQFQKIRWVETILISVPVLLIAVTSQLWYCTAIALSIILAFTFWSGTESTLRPIPTPFSKKPFEFIILFRRFWLLYLLLFTIGIIGVFVGNFNLAIIILLLASLLSLQAFDELEPPIILWNYKMSARVFLRHKIHRGIIQNWLMVLPYSIAIGIGFPTLSYWVIVSWGVMALLTTLIILVKYAVYPRRTTIIEGITLMILLLLPVLNLATLPYYYKKALKNLEQQSL